MISSATHKVTLTYLYFRPRKTNTWTDNHTWAWVLALGGGPYVVTPPLWRHCSLHKQNPLGGVWPPPCPPMFTWRGKAPVTFGVLQRLFPSWILWSSLQVSWSWEALATLHALELLLSSVIPFMHHDVEKLLRFQWFFLHGSSDGTF